MSADAGRRDVGAASIWVLACCALLMLLAAIVTVRGLAVLARHRAEAGADLAALAAAGRIGVSGDGCAPAAQVAQRNGGRLRSCRLHLAPDGRSGTADVAFALEVHLPLAGARTVVATARAGRSASGPTAWAVWHADPKVVPDGASVLR